MRVSNELFKAYIEDTNVLIAEMDTILKKRNSIGTLDRESVDALFRIFHTIKASAIVLDDSRIVDVSYKMENIVSYLRKHGPNSLDQEKVFDLLFESEYFFRDQLGTIVSSQKSEDSEEFEGDLQDFVEGIDFKEASPINMMVRFEAFRPLFENVIHEIGTDLGKKANLYFEGDHMLYVDRQLVTRLSGALTQIVRNAMDHGIETPEERIKLGKPEEGAITITYGLENGIMFVTIFNDGKTIDYKQVLKTADRLNMLKKPREQYTREEVANLVLERGFTTKTKIEKYSGRGVGMDIVKSTAKDLGGTIMVSSGESAGFSMTLAFPIDDTCQRAAIRQTIEEQGDTANEK